MLPSFSNEDIPACLDGLVHSMGGDSPFSLVYMIWTAQMVFKGTEKIVH